MQRTTTTPGPIVLGFLLGLFVYWLAQGSPAARTVIHTGAKVVRLTAELMDSLGQTAPPPEHDDD
jgi:hypothetical protein